MLRVPVLGHGWAAGMHRRGLGPPAQGWGDRWGVPLQLDSAPQHLGAQGWEHKAAPPPTNGCSHGWVGGAPFIAWMVQKLGLETACQVQPRPFFSLSKRK